MSIILRGHHLLCVHGFQGMGYSPNFVENMKKVVKKIRDEQNDFSIKVVAGFDDVCQFCPHKGEKECKAGMGANEHVLLLDQKVIAQLGIIEDAFYPKSYLLELTAKEIDPDDLDYLCHGCSWLKFGVCKEGIAKLNKRFKYKKIY